ncbi:MAG: BirA family transcriptional regulator [Thermoleophilaceae bacterium]|jgi:BirA family biotin operon repressor/biotin-[acetyl-CoA-carboxylase] ligase|nr:BirA family transcriptional regulator [Thermoleophilaceae bacterium]
MIGSPHVHHRVTDSTNARARELAAAGAPHGTIVTAAEQTAGRGRQGRSWTAAPGDALLFSLLVRGVKPGAALLPLAAAVAVCESLAPIEAAIKWPNDVWIERRKVAGILLEGRPQEGWAVIGIGLNVRTREFPAELQDTATSLALVGAADPEPDAARVALVAALDRWIAAPAEEVLEAWRARDALRGERVRWGPGSGGTAAGITDSGSLIVDTDAGERVELDAGEVHLQRPATAEGGA